MLTHFKLPQLQHINPKAVLVKCYACQHVKQILLWLPPSQLFLTNRKLVIELILVVGEKFFPIYHEKHTCMQTGIHFSTNN